MSLLCKLHHDEGITLVMVTHDVHLKMFADRVVWMRDGKIQRIETVDEDQKARVRVELAEFLESAKGNRLKEVQSTVQIRQPTDYETHTQFGGKSNAVELKLQINPASASGDQNSSGSSSSSASSVQKEESNHSAPSKNSHPPTTSDSLSPKQAEKANGKEKHVDLEDGVLLL